MKKSLFDLPKFSGRALIADLTVWIDQGDGTAFRAAWVEKNKNVGYFVITQSDEQSAAKIVGRPQYLDEAWKALSKIHRKLDKA